MKPDCLLKLKPQETDGEETSFTEGIFTSNIFKGINDATKFACQCIEKKNELGLHQKLIHRFITYNRIPVNQSCIDLIDRISELKFLKPYQSGQLENMVNNNSVFDH